MSGESFRDHLPLWLLSDEVLPVLSLDAYVYYSCVACGCHFGSDPALTLDRNSIRRAFACHGCGSERYMQLDIYPYAERLRCEDCGHQWGEHTSGFLCSPVCGSCGSTRAVQVSCEPARPMPATFTRVQDDPNLDSHVWGIDADADIGAISSAVKLNSAVPDAVRYLIPGALFAGRMFQWNSYSGGRWLLKNLEGIMLREYFKRVGLASAGTSAARVLIGLADAPDAPRDPAEHGMVCYNAAAVCYSLLNRPPAWLGVLPDEVREEGRRMCRQGLHLYADPAIHPELGLLQTARIWYLLGDLTRAGVPGEAELRESIECYDRALAQPVPDDFRGWVEESRSKAFRSMRVLTGRREGADELPLDYSAGDWARHPVREKCDWYRNAAIQLEEDGSLPGAEQALYLAAELAVGDLEAAADADALRLDTRAYTVLFADLARLNAMLGHPRAALEAVETIRAAVLRRATTPPDEAERRRAVTVLTRSVLDLLGKQPEAPQLSNLRAATSAERASPVIDQALAELAGSGWPEDIAVCSYTMSSGTVTAIIARLDSGIWTLDSTQWTADVADLTRGKDLLELIPSIFREQRLRSYCAVMSKVLLREILPVLRSQGIRRLAISAPGWFSHVPFEAAPAGGGALGDELELFYIPSFQTAASMASRLVPADGAGRVLVVPYTGPDLQGATTEVGRIVEIYKGCVDIADPEVPKRDLISQIRDGDYEIVHFACHGTFDMADQSRSALCLTAGGSRPATLLEARELTGTRFSRNPVVVLSACETGLSSLSFSSDYIGLTGAFLRMGARGVIGSRWAVYDDAAANFVERLHTGIAQGASAQRAVAAAQTGMRASCGIEDWAAFSYLGLPALRPRQGA